jgi:hypothetical protein
MFMATKAQPASSARMSETGAQRRRQDGAENSTALRPGSRDGETLHAALQIRRGRCSMRTGRPASLRKREPVPNEDRPVVHSHPLSRALRQSRSSAMPRLGRVRTHVNDPFWLILGRALLLSVVHHDLSATSPLSVSNCLGFQAAQPAGQPIAAADTDQWDWRLTMALIIVSSLCMHAVSASFFGLCIARRRW